MPRQRRGEPGIRKIEGRYVTRWEATVDLPPHPVTGKRRRQSERFESEQEAIDWRRAQLVAIRQGAWLERTSETVAEFATRWLASRSSIAPSTRAQYRRHLAHVIAAIGETPLQRLTVEHAELVKAAMAEDLSAQTAATTYGTFKAMLHTAVRWGLLLRNPADLVDRPRVERQERVIWTVPQMRRFLDETRDDPYSAAWHLAALSGLRRGELLALHWLDVDLVQGLVTVQFGRSTDDQGHQIIRAPKSRAGIRVVGIGPSTIAALTRTRDEQAFRRRAAGTAWVDLGLVFDGGDGSLLMSRRFNDHFQRLRVGLGLPYMRLHDLRHFAASVALTEAKVPDAVVSSMLGHASIVTTRTIYTHVHREQQVTAARQIEDAVWGRETG